jgi:hypothetical protein
VLDLSAARVWGLSPQKIFLISGLAYVVLVKKEQHPEFITNLAGVAVSFHMFYGSLSGG